MQTEFKKDFEAFMEKWDVTDYVFGVSFDNEMGYITAKSCDLFLANHIEKCMYALKMRTGRKIADKDLNQLSCFRVS